jgi:hypothetical protein
MASKKLSKTDYGLAFDYAFKAASKACTEYLTKYPNNWYPCGFAWVIFDGRDPAVKWLKENKATLGRLAGDKGYPKGWHIWDPANSNTQCMDAKVEGTKAFCEILRKYGIECDYDARMD